MRARFLVLVGLRAASPCFDVVLLDSFGDGWQGAAVVVTRAKDALSPPLLVGQLASGYSETVELCLADGCYDVAVGEDLYASEVSVVVDGRATAGAPANASFAVEAGRVGAWGSCATRAPTLTAAPSASARPTAAPSHPCAEIVLRDSYGDGWQGAALAISRGAVAVFTGALASGDEAVHVACLDDGCYAAALGNDTYPSDAAFVVGAPLAALAALRRNRPAGRVAPPSELAKLDGALASLTQRYTPQFWWFEAVAVLVRLLFGGLTVVVGAGKESDIPNFKGSYLGRFPLVSADFGRAIISRNGLEAWMLLSERACAEHSS